MVKSWRNRKIPHLFRCLKKPFGLPGPHEMERESDAVYYDNVYCNDNDIPKLSKVGRAWKYVF